MPSGQSHQVDGSLSLASRRYGWRTTFSLTYDDVSVTCDDVTAWRNDVNVM